MELTHAPAHRVPHCGTDLALLLTRPSRTATATWGSAEEESSSAPASTTWWTTSCTWALARLPTHLLAARASALFAVPKFNVDADGNIGERNGIYCGGLEHKMVIHSQRHRPAGAGQGAGGGGHPDRPASKGPAGDVRDDERRPPGRRQPVARPRPKWPSRTRWPTPRSACRCAACPASRPRTSRPIYDHRVPGRAPHAADGQGLCRRRSRAERGNAGLLLDKP